MSLIDFISMGAIGVAIISVIFFSRRTRLIVSESLKDLSNETVIQVGNGADKPKVIKVTHN